MDVQKIREEIIYLARQQPELAIERTDALVADFPDEAWTWSMRSYVHGTQYNFDEALSDIEKAIKIQFDEPANHFDKARFLIKLENFDNAIISFSEAINIGERLKFLYYDKTCRFFRAFCYCKTGRFEDAKTDLDKVDDDMQTWIDRLRSKEELLEACQKRQLD